jgi:murein DD-endopeptidase MepM/ murein hydrolase activator NlpD
MVVTVGYAQTLDDVAMRYGVPVNELLRANQISNPADVKPGRVLVIPRRVASAMPAPARPTIAATPAVYTPTAPRAGGSVHIVEPGQTLYSIARMHDVSVDDIAALNNLASTEQIRVGQHLKLPNGGTPVAQTVAYASPASKPRVAPIATPASLGPRNLTPPAPSAPPAMVARKPDLPSVPAVPTVPVVKQDTGATVASTGSAIDNAGDPASATGTAFRWPVRGRIISGFGTKPNGERNDGINLAVPEGTSVKAAEAGTVIYAGNELQGYGNLILIRHADGWVSAYAHNSKILVKRGDIVHRGENIALAGMSGSVTAPQVHFELRKGSKPVNPLDFLSG